MSEGHPIYEPLRAFNTACKAFAKLAGYDVCEWCGHTSQRDLGFIVMSAVLLDLDLGGAVWERLCPACWDLCWLKTPGLALLDPNR